jgi:DNA-binding MarR family transcriptional regulator
MSAKIRDRQHAVKLKLRPRRTAAGTALSVFVVQVMQLNGLLLAAGDALAAPAGQTSARWQILAAVEGAPMSVADIARLMNLARQSVQRIADLLVEDGLASYEDNPAHARAKHLCLCASGRHTLARIQDAQRQWADELAARLDLEHLSAASGLLAQMKLLLQSGANET